MRKQLRVSVAVLMLLGGPALAEGLSTSPDSRPRPGDLITAGKASVNISGAWTFQQSPLVPTPSTSDSSTKAASTAFVKAQGYGAGSVTSVGVSAPAEFTVTSSPVTGAGTISIGKATENANTVWAGPSSGSAAQPSFRGLVGADLPSPGSSTLGGVESYTSPAHQWINIISTSGSPSSSQPNYTDLAGALPNPGASTLGGIESIAAVSHQWIASISTSGAPALSQPAFTDISGSATTSQLPSFTNAVAAMGSMANAGGI